MSVVVVGGGGCGCLLLLLVGLVLLLLLWLLSFYLCFSGSCIEVIYLCSLMLLCYTYLSSISVCLCCMFTLFPLCGCFDVHLILFNVYAPYCIYCTFYTLYCTYFLLIDWAYSGHSDWWLRGSRG